MTGTSPSRLPYVALLLALLAAALCSRAAAPETGPYDESADADAEIAAALDRAGHEGKRVLLVFGANWCPDCRALGAAMEEPEVHAVIDAKFVVAHVDIGRWDRNTDIVRRWGKPTSRGIPSVVVANADGTSVYVTRKGEAARARKMDKDDFLEFFRLLADLP